jgi:hypothetical protein
MDKDKALNELIIPQLRSEEQLIGFFQAQYLPSMWWILLIGPLLFLGMRMYYIAVTDQGLYLHKFNMPGGISSSDYFVWNEIVALHLGSGLLQAPLKLEFINGTKIKLRAQLKGVKKVAKLDEDTRSFLVNKQK